MKKSLHRSFPRRFIVACILLGLALLALRDIPATARPAPGGRRSVRGGRRACRALGKGQVSGLRHVRVEVSGLSWPRSNTVTRRLLFRRRKGPVQILRQRGEVPSVALPKGHCLGLRDRLLFARLRRRVQGLLRGRRQYLRPHGQGTDPLRERDGREDLHGGPHRQGPVPVLGRHDAVLKTLE